MMHGQKNIKLSILKFIFSFTIYSWIALNEFFNDSSPILNQFVNRCLVLQKKNFLRTCEITKSLTCFIHAANSKVSTSLSPLPCKFAVNFCQINVRTGRMRRQAGVFWMLFTAFFSLVLVTDLARPFSVAPHPKFPGDIYQSRLQNEQV